VSGNGNGIYLSGGEGNYIYNSIFSDNTGDDMAFKNDGSIGSGLLIGLQMNFRAAVIILGFAVLGTELYNPKIRNFFMKTSFKQLPIALELSFESLPSLLAEMPDFKTIVKQPISVLYHLISQVEDRLAEIKNKANSRPEIFIITGAVGQGKTNCVREIIKMFQQENIPVSGVLSPRVVENDETIGYDVVDIKNEKREVFLRRTGGKDLERIGRYYIFPAGLQQGRDALSLANTIDSKMVVIDEVGKLELEDRGWAGCLQSLIDASRHHILLTVRDKFVEEVVQKWDARPFHLYDIAEHDGEAIGSSIMASIKGKG
jgi:nucleoside-triphosphatase THEP1